MSLVKVECMKCSGTGHIQAFNHIMGGVCFACEGKGYRMLKSIPKPSKKYYVSIRMEENDAEIKQWIGVNAHSEKEALKKSQKIAIRGCYAKWIDTICIEEVERFIHSSELQENN
jgi:hypothetical protein